jgi:prepilin-type processing-associated H-X9-DG protein
MPRASSRNRRKTSPAAALLLVVCLVAGYAVWNYGLFDAPDNARGLCTRNLNIISLALREYEARHGHLPAASMVAKRGQPPHSWRVAILAQLAHKELLMKYDFNQAWDSPKNRALAGQMPDVLRCPGSGKSGSKTNFMMLVGEHSIGRRHGEEGLRLDKVIGPAESKFLVVEVPGEGVDWMEPRDITVDELTQRLGSGQRAPHVNGFNVAFCDGGVRLVPLSVDIQSLRRMADITDPEPVDTSRF